MENFDIGIDGVEGAAKVFDEFLPELVERLKQVRSEEDTRMKIINPMFSDVLGWELGAIATEEPTGDGFLDYKFSIDGRARLIVEAKRDSKSFGTEHRNVGRTYELSGPVLNKSPHPKQGILQAASYCGAKNAELACVTNGNEWIIFRGSRLGDGKDTLDGKAFLFPSLESIKENFKLFYDLLGRPRVEQYIFRAYFQEAEGQPIRARAFSRTLRPANGYRLVDRNALANDVDRVMTAFFRKLSGDDDAEMLAKCFVTTKESQIADEKLTRMADDLVSKIRDLDTHEGTALIDIVQRVRETKRNEFALVVGTKGAGKSTFMDRFFLSVIPSELREECIVTRLDVGKSHGDIDSVIKWLNHNLLEHLEHSLFEDGNPSYDELQGMYFDEYKRWLRGPYKPLYESDKAAFKQKFGEHIDNRREARPEEYIQRMIRHIVHARRKVPCLVFDNTDHYSIPFQERVFQYARSIYENEICLVIIPITDKTSWQLSQQGALQSFDNEAFYLPTPQPRLVVERRIQFLEDLIKDEGKEKASGYLFGKGINLSITDLKGFVACLQHVFLETGEVSTWIGMLANNDIRRCLELSRDIVGSSYLRVDELLSAFIAKSTCHLAPFDVKRAIIRKGYNYYPVGQHKFIQNIFALNTEVEATPLLGLRILRLLRDAKHHDAGGLEDYVTVDQALDYLLALGIDRRATLLCLDAMLKTGLCLSYDPTIQDISQAKKIQLSPSGLQHLLWGSWDETYISSMLQVTPIANAGIYDQLKACNSHDNNFRWAHEVGIFLQYLIQEDSEFTIDLNHEAYSGQRKLIYSLTKKMRKMDEFINRNR